MRTHRAVLVLIFAALGAVPSISLGASTGPGAIALHPGDVRGYTITQSVYIDNSTAARADKVKFSTFQRHGRIVSYKIAASRSRRLGLFRIENIVAQFRSSSGAQWDYKRIARRAAHRKAGRSYHSVQGIAARGLGWSRTAITYEAGSGKKSLVIALLRFYRGKYRVSIEVIGTASSHRRAAATLALHLGRVIDSRLRHAR